MRRALWRAGFAIFVAAAGHPGRAATIFAPGLPPLPVFVARGAGPEEQRAAGELGRILGLVSGRDWPVLVAGDAAVPGIYIGAGLTTRGGATLRVAQDPLAPASGEVGPDAFRIWCRGEQLTIEGATPEACVFAVAWFAQERAGARWYAPGPSGEVVLERPELVVPDGEQVVQPAYYSRELTGFEDAEGETWGERNGLRRRLRFSHALARSFTPEVFAAHPDWYPATGGARSRTSSATPDESQPNMALPEVAQWAAEAALAGYAVEPREISFSLGINDSTRFDEGEVTRRSLDPLRYFRGMPDYSPLVFGFMDRVAAITATRRPDRYLGCLAYFWCQNAPPFRVDPHVVPYVASDRSQYFDTGFRAGDKDLLARWSRSGVRTFGLWDYAFGDGFIVPREPLAYLAEGIRYGWKQGARGYLAEIGHAGSFETFKAWAVARLLWNPNLTLDHLEDDFFAGYFGPAGESMRAFFDQCQSVWERQQGPPLWLKYYRQADQALLFPPDVCRSLRSRLAVARAVTASDPVIAARVDSVRRAFARTEAFLQFDSARRRVASIVPDRPNVKVGDVEEALRDLAQARRLLAAQDQIIPAPMLNEDPAGAVLFALGVKNSAGPERLLQRITAQSAAPSGWRVMASAMAAGVDRKPNLAANSTFLAAHRSRDWPSFLYPGMGELPDGWTVRAMATELGCIALSGRDRLSRDLRIEAAWDTQLYQWIPAQPGMTYLATSWQRGTSSPGADAGLVLTFLSAAGEPQSTATQALPKGSTPDWRRAALADLAPPGAAWVGIGVTATRQLPGDFFEVRAIELRGARLASAP